MNNNLAEPKMGMPNYNPCSKYDYAYKVLLHKINYVTGRADMTAVPALLVDVATLLELVAVPTPNEMVM